MGTDSSTVMPSEVLELTASWSCGGEGERVDSERMADWTPEDTGGQGKICARSSEVLLR